MSFLEVLSIYNWGNIKSDIYTKTRNDVERALNNTVRDSEDFKALVSPAAEAYLEQMAVQSQRLTLKRFGKTIQLFIPLYLSNVCENQCVYCGFSSKNQFKRIVLNDDQIMQEVQVLKSHGYEHILLVTGESHTKAGVEYLKHVIQLIRPHFSLISIEVQPLEQKDYEELIALGLTSVYIYQETYNRETYPSFHPKGKKSDFAYRLETPERLGRAGIHKIGIGTLIGLDDWRVDAFFTALHVEYLSKQFWKTNLSISFPRLRPHAGAFDPKYATTEKYLLQLICAYRMFDENLELSLSVRERKEFRDNAMKLGITTMSAGSKTDPGGYSCNVDALKQFEEHDSRTPQEVEAMIKKQGYDPVWKGWDPVVQGK